MIVFELTMPNKGSWNGKWSEEGTCFARTYSQNKVPKEYWNKDFYYRWDDGWTACVSVTQMSATEARKIARRSKGFCGYDWMIKSIIECGEILTESERKAMRERKHKQMNEKRCPVGGVDRSGKVDRISIQAAVETPFWMMVWAAEPTRPIEVSMTYSDLKVICDLIDRERKRKGAKD